MELGFHLANLTFDGGAPQLRDTIARIAHDAEAGGLARITVMDHLWQISGYGPPELDMLEAYTLLGFLAANTQKVLLHTMVTGVVYREPGLLAKQISTLDVLSGGRAGLGIGAAWNDEEAAGLGLFFPSQRERFARLEEALQIVLQMWSDSEEPYEGRYYHLGRTLSSPATISQPRPYLLIGGVGERKTLRLVAQYADACNLFSRLGTEELTHKLDVLRAHCDAVGRDYGDIEKTANMSLDPDSTVESLVAELEPLHELGFTAAYVSSRDPQPLHSIELLSSAASVVADW